MELLKYYICLGLVFLLGAPVGVWLFLVITDGAKWMVIGVEKLDEMRRSR